MAQENVERVVEAEEEVAEVQDAANDESYTEEVVEETLETVATEHRREKYDPWYGYANKDMIAWLYSSVEEAECVSDIMIALITLKEMGGKKYIAENGIEIDVEKSFAIVKGEHLDEIKDSAIAKRVEELHGAERPEEIDESLDSDIVDQEGDSVRVAKEKKVNKFYKKLEDAQSHIDVMVAVINLALKADVYIDGEGQEVGVNKELERIKVLDFDTISDKKVVERLYELGFTKKLED